MESYFLDVYKFYLIRFKIFWSLQTHKNETKQWNVKQSNVD